MPCRLARSGVPRPNSGCRQSRFAIFRPISGHRSLRNEARIGRRALSDLNPYRRSFPHLTTLQMVTTWIQSDHFPLVQHLLSHRRLSRAARPVKGEVTTESARLQLALFPPRSLGDDFGRALTQDRGPFLFPQHIGPSGWARPIAMTSRHSEPCTSPCGDA
jgi:hypothetical protein